MDGLKLAAAISGRWPPIKIVATSGLVKITPLDHHFLPKPYSARADRWALRKVTGDARSFSGAFRSIKPTRQRDLIVPVTNMHGTPMLG
jgi:hypothetical protein